MFALLAAATAAQSATFNKNAMTWYSNAPDFLKGIRVKTTIPEQNTAAFRWFQDAPKFLAGF